MRDTVYLIRDTENPEADLARGFSGNVGAWFADKAAADAFAAKNGSLAPPRQCPESKMWCGDPELGLSAFVVTEDTIEDALEKIAVYVEWREEPTLAVFASEDVEIGVGLDGEDCFRDGRLIGRVPYPFNWQDLQALMQPVALVAP